MSTIATIDLSALMACTLPLQVDDCSYGETPAIENEIGRVGTTVKLDGEGFIQGVDDPTFEAAIAALSTSTSISGQTLTITGPGGGTLHQVAAASCLEGGPHVGFQILAERAGTRYRRVKFSLQAKTIASTALNSFKIGISTAPDGLSTITQNGVLVGSGAAAAFTAVVNSWYAAYPLGDYVTRHQVAYPGGGAGVISNLTGRYTLVAEQLATALPAAGTVCQGEVTQRSERDEQWRMTTVMEYDLVLTGGNYQSLVSQLRPEPATLIREAVSFSSIKEFRLRASFTTLSSANNDNLLSYTETWEATAANDTYAEYSYPGIDPIAVQKPKTFPRLVQSGRAVGLNSFPKAPDAYWDDDEDQQRTGLTAMNNYEYETSWSYQQILTDGSDLNISELASQVGRPDSPSFY